MAADRYVLLGLARPRAEWFRAVGQWATSGALPAEFLKCVSVEELRARLAAGRPYSAAILDGAIPAVDRDVLAAAREAGCVVVVVDDGRGARDWRALGAAAVLAPGFTREALLDVLASHAELVARRAAAAVEDGAAVHDLTEARATVVAVLGPGGTGASTVAAALAQGLDGPVVLADLALHAEQAMLHDVRDVVPGVQELVEASRARHLAADDVRALTFEVVERRYFLLLGLRRSRYWSTIRPRAFAAAFDALRRSFGVVVCDVSADLEAEEDAGSVDVGERNVMARAAVLGADVVLVVGRSGVKGLHSLVRVVTDVVAAGVPPERVVPVVNMAPRSPKARAELTAALAELVQPATTAPPVFLPARRVEEALRDAVPLPSPLPATVAAATQAVLARVGPVDEPPAAEPELVVPGSLGAWPDEEAAG
jgi:hypothetical protein